MKKQRKAEEEYGYLSKPGRPAGRIADNPFWHHGNGERGGPLSRVYDPQSRVFSIDLQSGERRGCFAVYVGMAHPDIDLGFALRWLVDTASRAEEETYERWLAEDGTFYQTELGDEGARAMYDESHTVYHKLRRLLGEEAYRAFREAIG